MIACLRVRCGSSVYVQKKSCSFVSSGGASSISVDGEGVVRSRAVALGLFDLAVVMVEVEAAIVTSSWPLEVIEGGEDILPALDVSAGRLRAELLSQGLHWFRWVIVYFDHSQLQAQFPTSFLHLFELSVIWLPINMFK